MTINTKIITVQDSEYNNNVRRRDHVLGASTEYMCLKIIHTYLKPVHS